MEEENKKYRKIFSEVRTPEPPADLAHKTLLAIVRHERRVLMTKLIGLGVLFATSLTLAISEITAAGTQLTQSGFFQFASLFFSDFGVATRNIPDFFFSTLESFPIFSVGLAIGGLAIAMWSLAGFVDDASVLRNS